MKTRFGFVSNSSSSSFAIYGKSVDTREFLKELEGISDIIDIDKFIDDCDYFYDENYQLSKFIKEKYGLNIYISYEDREDSYIGINYSDLNNYETTKEFFQKAESILGDGCRFICEEIQE